MAEELLAERELVGYPNTKVQLRVDLTTEPVSGRVLVTDGLGTTELPIEAYLHPFAFGYFYPQEYVEDHDGSV